MVWGGGPRSGPGAAIRIDHILNSSLWGKKESPGEGALVPFPEVLRRLLEKLQRWSRVVRIQGGGGGGQVAEVIRKGSLKPMTAVVEKRAGHVVTVVSRVEGFGFVPEELAAALQRKFGTACSVAKIPGKTESDCEIMLQGDLLKKIVAFFTETEGIESKHLETNNKLTKNKR